MKPSQADPVMTFARKLFAEATEYKQKSKAKGKVFCHAVVLAAQPKNFLNIDSFGEVVAALKQVNKGAK